MTKSEWLFIKNTLQKAVAESTDEIHDLHCAIILSKVERNLKGIELEEKKLEELMDSIYVNKANFEHMAQTGRVNGTLRTEVRRIVTELLEYVNKR